MSGDYSHDDYMPSLSVPIGQFHNTLMLIETINLIKLSTTDLQQPALSSHESLDEEDSLGQCILQAMDNKPIRTKNKKGGCSCKKTNCLKMYCECYSTGKVCTENCGCFGCQNCKETSLGTKPQLKSKTGIPPNRHTNRGCNCKKSQCQKKYCQCYNAGLGCTDSCNCSDCMNQSNLPKESKECGHGKR